MRTHCIIIEQSDQPPALVGLLDFHEYRTRSILLDTLEDLPPFFTASEDSANEFAEFYELGTELKAHVVETGKLEPQKLREWYNRVRAEIQQHQEQRGDAHYGKRLAQQLFTDEVFDRPTPKIEVTRKKKIRRPVSRGVGTSASALGVRAAAPIVPRRYRPKRTPDVRKLRNAEGAVQLKSGSPVVARPRFAKLSECPSH
ncbi:MAG: hypothetical protein AAFQ45_05735 [Pseudomonadota bacterium]